MMTWVEQLRRRGIMLLVLFALAGGSAVWSPQPTQAQVVFGDPDRKYELHYYHYSDASYTTQVGYRYINQCTGERFSQGTITIYYRLYRDLCG